MGFKKPFRAVPIQVGAYQHRQARRRFAREAGRVGALAVIFGLVAGYGGTFFEVLGGSPSSIVSAPGGATSFTPTYVYYSNCADARQAGATPIYAGEPGYRPELDGDSDGIACEPYRY
jgi:Excalibur calcium-binding domain